MDRKSETKPRSEPIDGQPWLRVRVGSYRKYEKQGGAALFVKPSVIMMDINLPGISGFEVLKILRKDPITAHIPVIAISANVLPLDIERGLKAGLFLYITKPIKVKEFMEAVYMALEFAEKRLVRKYKLSAYK